MKAQKKLHADTISALDKGKDLDTLKKIMLAHFATKKAIIKKAIDLPKEKRIQISEKFFGNVQTGHKKIRAALERYHKRLKGDKNPVVVMDTSLGKVKIELYPSLAPITVKNFLKYVDDKFYDGTIFHRVIPTFMVQGGGFLPGMKEKDTRANIKNEAYNGLSNKRGTIAMARLSDPDTASSQFFINVNDNLPLDKLDDRFMNGYTVFGKVIDGLDVVDKIKAVETGTVGRFEDVPVKSVVIRSIRRAK